MRILVIGGTCFIGPPVVRRLADLGHEVTVYHRGEHEAPLPAEVKHVHHKRAGMPVTWFPEELRAWSPEVVVHMTPLGEDDARACADAFRGVARRVVALSSGDVYRAYGIAHHTELGPPEPLPLTEDAKVRRSLYPYRSHAAGAGEWIYHYDKILAERVLLAEPRLPATILRLPMVYGPGDTAHRVQPYLRQMDKGCEEIVIEGKLARWRFQQGYVENVAHAVVLAVAAERAAKKIYHVGHPDAPTTAAWVRQIGEVAGWQGQVVFGPPSEDGPEQDVVYDTSRIRRELGYGEIVAAKEALRRTIAWERSLTT